jgi:hypothetical protein
LAGAGEQESRHKGEDKGSEVLARVNKRLFHFIVDLRISDLTDRL